MKLGKLLLGTLLLVSVSSYAQDDAERECTRMRFLAGEELKIKNYAAASSYYLKGEELCGNYDAKQYARMIGTLRNTINSTQDKTQKAAYADTLSAAYDRAEAKGFYNEKEDLIRAANELSRATPDRKKADQLFRRGIATQGTSTNQAYVSYFYYNTYAIFFAAADAEKAEAKKTMISDYFELSALISKAGMSAQTQETITGYFNAVVKSCDDILPDLKGYMENLPTDLEVKKVAVNNFISLLEKKECTTSPEYFQLIDILVELDPSSLDTKMKQANALIAQKKYSAGIKALKEAKALATEDTDKNKINYSIARAQLSSGSYTSAYNTAMSVQGDLRGDALAIAGRAVGNNANNCGASTFDRKCNYIYAVQLLEQARAKGGNVGGAIGSFRKNFPTDQEKFENGNPASVTLSCYGVTVNP